MTTLGNIEILRNEKIAFFASREVKAKSVIASYDWAMQMSREGKTVISGFQSKLEQDVLHFLLKGTQPIIKVMARRLPRQKLCEEELKAVDDGRLLIVSLNEQPRCTKESASVRNEYIAESASSIIFASLTAESSLFALYEEMKRSDKNIILI